MIEAMAGSATPQTSSTGWGALRAANWEEARAAFEAELAGQETAAALDGLARARWWLSDIPGAVEAWERAYTAYRRAGLDEPAAHVAVLLSREHAEGLRRSGLERRARRTRARSGSRSSAGRRAALPAGRLEDLVSAASGPSRRLSR
jgi:hypothetical protein